MNVFHFRVAFQVTNSQRRAWHPRRKNTVEEEKKLFSATHKPTDTAKPQVTRAYFNCSNIPFAFGNTSLQPTPLHGISPKDVTNLNTGNCDQSLNDKMSS